MSAQIHASAIVSPKAQLGKDVIIGPFCTIGDQVSLGNNVELKSHVVLEGNTTIGDKTIIYPFASIGSLPQGSAENYNKECKLMIGKNNCIREYVTMQPGTINGGGITTVGDNGLYMAGCHVAHDCHIGNNVIMANYATLAGHVTIGDFANIGGLAAVHQFVRIGHNAFIGGKAGINHDVIPYALVMGRPDNLAGLNLVGLKRLGINREEIMEMLTAYEELFADNRTLQERINEVSEKYSSHPRVIEIIDFINEDSKRAISLPAA